jgi:transcription initiation factor TFIID subunit 1
MDDEDSFMDSLGLGKLLASEGVDTSGLNTLLSRGGGASTSNELVNIDNDSDDDAKYEDDLSDHDLLPETETEKAAREKEKHEEARYRRMALQMNKELEAKRATVKGKGKAKEDPKDIVKRIWPDFEPGRRLRMTDVLYETPYSREQYKQASYRRKRRKVVHEAKRTSHNLLEPTS